ncbi:MAG: translocation/assembly module TamB domain-containing protein [Candidatus Omnitrophota bacterium]
MKTKTIILIFMASILLTAGLLYFFIFTGQGALMIARFGIKNYAQTDTVEINKSQGSLAKGITYYNLELNDIKILPEGSVVKIQQLDLNLDSLNFDGLQVKVQNARLFLPNMDTILFYGSYENKTLDLSVYSKGIHVRSLFNLLPGIQIPKSISGLIEGFDIIIKGKISEPNLIGEFFVNELKWHKFVMRQCPIALNLNVSDIKKDIKIYGEIVLKSGEISGEKTALVKLQESKIIFSGKPKQPNFDLYGISVVEKTKINITVKGELDTPEVKLSSEPFLSEDKLTVMLATGKSWMSIFGSLENSRVSPDIAADLVDYFIFGGAGNRLAKRLGLNSVLLKYNGNTKEAQITKEVSGKTELKYGIEQTKLEKDKAVINQKIAVEQKITESFAVEAEKNIQINGKENQAENDKKEADGETNIWLKFKKGF